VRISRAIVFVISMFLLCNAASAQRKAITNDDVIRLVQNGFADDQVLALMAASEPKFDLSVDALIALKEAGASQKLVEAILLSARTPTPTAPPPGGIAPGLSAAPTINTPPSQPYVQLLAGSDRPVLVSHIPAMLQTSAKGDNMTTILADSAITKIGSDVVMSAATTAIMAAPGFAAIPIVGVAGVAIQRIPGLRRDPTVTLVYALERRQSGSPTATNQPKFEIFFGDIVGVNPADFIPALIKISPTENNWRMTGALRTNPKYLQSKERIELKFIEDIVPTRVAELGRGHMSIEPQAALQPGEYGVVLRPKSKSWKINLSSTVTRDGEGAVIRSVWDFTVQAGN
jgi:hypothetical protein